MAYLQISIIQLLLAALLLAVNVVLALIMRLNLAQRMVWSATRMVVQLLLVGIVLQWIFQSSDGVLVVAVVLVMCGIAGVTAVGRAKRRFAGVYWRAVVSVSGATMLVAGVTVVGILPIDPWYKPQYLIPFVGMLLGNALTGISLGLDRYLDSLVTHRRHVELRLSLGATAWEAGHEQFRDALRTGLIPLINSMTVAGLVSIPGMMTGQMLAGANPADAARYQILIFFMIAAVTSLGTLAVLLLSHQVLFNRRYQLLASRIRAAK